MAGCRGEAREGALVSSQFTGEVAHRVAVRRRGQERARPPFRLVREVYTPTALSRGSGCSLGTSPAGGGGKELMLRAPHPKICFASLADFDPPSKGGWNNACPMSAEGRAVRPWRK